MAFPLLALVLAAITLVSAHDDHDHGLQMPLDYVKFPYQAVYPGDDEGKELLMLSLSFSYAQCNSYQ